MDISGEHRIPAPREAVWKGLNDPEVLRQCLPGCESMEQTGEHEYQARLLAAVGPVKARFNMEIRVTDLNPPESYTISGQGKGGPAGFGKGGAEVTLEEDGGETVLRYKARVQVGGKLAQVGSRLVDGTARKIAQDFFQRFSEVVAGGGEAAAGGAQEGGGSRGAGAGRGRSTALWIGAAVVVVIAVAIAFSL